MFAASKYPSIVLSSVALPLSVICFLATTSRLVSHTSRLTTHHTSSDTHTHVHTGTSSGAILVFNVPAQGTDVALLRQLQGHSAPVCDIATNQQGEVASCDESGMILVWTDPLTSPDSSLVMDQSGGAACLSLCFWNSTLIGGFTNGKILLFSTDSGAKTVEISAHARCINALDVAPKAGLLLSVSEDSTAAVWSLPTDSNPKVSQVFSTTILNSLLCGGKFCDPRGTKFSLTAYDSAEVITFSKS